MERITLDQLAQEMVPEKGTYQYWLLQVDRWFEDLEEFCITKLGFPSCELNDETFMEFYKVEFDERNGEDIQI